MYTLPLATTANTTIEVHKEWHHIGLIKAWIKYQTEGSDYAIWSRSMSFTKAPGFTHGAGRVTPFRKIYR